MLERHANLEHWEIEHVDHHDLSAAFTVVSEWLLLPLQEPGKQLKLLTLAMRAVRIAASADREFQLIIADRSRFCCL